MHTRVKDPADPRRCQGHFQGRGQCERQALEGATRCAGCGGEREAREYQRRMYLLSKAKYRERLARLSNHSDDELKSLREEIALARMLIEERLNLIEHETDVLSAFGPLQQSFLTVEKLVKSAHQIEQTLGSLLSKDAVIRLGQAISDIIVEELRDVPGHEELVDRINNRIIESIASLQNE